MEDGESYGPGSYFRGKAGTMHGPHSTVEGFTVRHLDLQIGEHAVIVGENKIGKSNLLFALQLILDPALADTDRCLRMEDFWDGLPRPLTADDRIEVSVEFAEFDNNTDHLALLGEYLVKSGSQGGCFTLD